MIDKNLAEQLKYSSSEWVFVVTWDNVLKQMFTPFKVLVLSDVGQLVKGEIVLVEQVKVTYQLKTVFMVKGNAYYYFHFDFVIEY
jgi:hypothetical protein